MRKPQVIVRKRVQSHLTFGIESQDDLDNAVCRN